MIASLLIAYSGLAMTSKQSRNITAKLLCCFKSSNLEFTRCYSSEYVFFLYCFNSTLDLVSMEYNNETFKCFIKKL